MCVVRHTQQGEREARESEAEFLQRGAARHGLGHAFGQFIEFIVHNFAFILMLVPSGLVS
ncbi:MAG TPA: hypothetical protein VEO53_16575 [Candidatus Binatia bacterium]|nr:hypothetical protein [Candidatus Binatia bacterium]